MRTERGQYEVLERESEEVNLGQIMKHLLSYGEQLAFPSEGTAISVSSREPCGGVRVLEGS